jgi:hypothetical protein
MGNKFPAPSKFVINPFDMNIESLWSKIFIPCNFVKPFSIQQILNMVLGLTIKPYLR